MKKIILYLGICLFLLTACQINNTSNTQIGDNFDVGYMNVNEVGIFGVIGANGIGYYDIANKDTIQILKNEEEPFRVDNTQGICYYKDKIYYFDNKKNANLMVMDTNGKNQKKLLDLADTAYDATNTDFSFIYNDNNIVFRVNYTKFNPDSSKNKTWTQLHIYDIGKDNVTPITEKGLIQTEADNTLVSYINGKVIYASTSEDEGILGMQDYEKKYGSTLKYPFYLIQHTGKTLYSYDVKTKKTETLLQGKGIEYAFQNARLDNELIYRQGDDIKKIDVNTKKITSLVTEKNLYTMRSTMDKKIFFSTLEKDINHIKYYDTDTKTVTESQTFRYDSDDYFFPNYETKDYFVGVAGDKGYSIIKKADFYNKKFKKLMSIGW